MSVVARYRLHRRTCQSLSIPGTRASLIVTNDIERVRSREEQKSIALRKSSCPLAVNREFYSLHPSGCTRNARSISFAVESTNNHELLSSHSALPIAQEASLYSIPVEKTTDL